MLEQAHVGWQTAAGEQRHIRVRILEFPQLNQRLDAFIDPQDSLVRIDHEGFLRWDEHLLGSIHLFADSSAAHCQRAVVIRQ